jgi:hypothetical protein
VDLIGQLFALEKQVKDGSVAERLALRQMQSALVLAELRRKLLDWKERLLPKHPMAEAVNYTLSQWEELTSKVPHSVSDLVFHLFSIPEIQAVGSARYLASFHSEMPSTRRLS